MAASETLLGELHQALAYEFKGEIKDTLKDIKTTLEIVRSQVVRK